MIDIMIDIMIETIIEIIIIKTKELIDTV